MLSMCMQLQKKTIVPVATCTKVICSYFNTGFWTGFEHEKITKMGKKGHQTPVLKIAILCILSAAHCFEPFSLQNHLHKCINLRKVTEVFFEVLSQKSIMMQLEPFQVCPTLHV